MVSLENPERAEDVCRQLERCTEGRPVGYIPNNRLLGGYFTEKKITWLRGRVFLARLVVHLMDSCNLKCRGCSHFSNLFGEGEEYDFAALLSDWEKIRELAYAPCLYLLGGEPLLNPRIEAIVCEARRLFEDSDIEIVTNGLQLPKMSDSFFRLAADKRVHFSITMYPPTWKQREEIRMLLEAHRLEYTMGQLVSEFRACFNPPGKYSSGQISMSACGADYCRFLRQGKLYKCPVAALTYKYNEHFGACLPYGEGIDLNAADFRQQALAMCKPIELCRYCAERPKMREWQVSTQPVAEEWY